ncbi:MAG TPA: hypothetical protein VGJ00_00725 [Rhabdochlamydiaceae bacterium]|jgi:GNAT superfamily N-acetyltransferase
MLLLTDIHVRSFTGSSIKNYLHSIAKLLVQIFKEYPYLLDANIAQQAEYIKNVATYKESIAVLIFDNTTLVGASIGVPLIAEPARILQPFHARQTTIQDYYFFSASLLLKPYRGRGIGHHFFDVREAHVLHYKKYAHICFCAPQMSESDPDRPDDYLPLDDFWRKRGYIHHPDMHCRVPWQSINKQLPEEKQLSFWIKDLH